MSDEEDAARAEHAERVRAQNEQIIRAYHVCFGGPAGQMVLTDLAAFCRGAETTFVPGDPGKSAFLEGRRDVLLRIQQRARLSDAEILQLRLGRIQPRLGATEE